VRLSATRTESRRVRGAGRNARLRSERFDETSKGPWEWDVKRLATSLILACEESALSARVAEVSKFRALASACLRIFQ
jgi:uncharacterized protein (DUF2252 family)